VSSDHEIDSTVNAVYEQFWAFLEAVRNGTGGYKEDWNAKQVIDPKDMPTGQAGYINRITKDGEEHCWIAGQEDGTVIPRCFFSSEDARQALLSL
jgi:hypothetical protein